jgi:hypothetical protein
MKQFEDKIRKEIRKILQESFEEDLLPESYPSEFNMELFKSLKTFKDRIEYCQAHLIILSSGTGRIVFKIDNEKVLKLAKNTKGVAQNENEIKWGKDYYYGEILANVFDSENNALWVEMELANKLTKKLFKEILGFDFDSFAYYIRNFELQQQGHKGFYWPIDTDIKSLLIESRFVQMVTSFIESGKLGAGDLARLNSYGMVLRDGDDELTIVIVDFGLSDEVHDTHYSVKPKPKRRMYEGENITEERELGTSLASQFKTPYITIYRACALSQTEFHDKDYITLIKDWAIAHAESGHIS